ncbi:MAG: AmmeMemoRadiSam system protein B [Thermoguttaceae bacterium]|jgi:AmmeMemoRadiSam system protein B
MSVPPRPRLRLLDVLPVGPEKDDLVALRDPEGFGRTTVLPRGAAIVALLMDGRRTLRQIQAEFRTKTGVTVGSNDIHTIVGRLDEAHLLDGERFQEHRRQQVENYLRSPIRPAWHAGGAYAADPAELAAELAALLACDGAPGPIRPPAHGQAALRGVLSPHIDPQRGGAAFAWAYQTIAARSDADLFVIFGTAHQEMDQLFSVSRKDFQTPLGVVPTAQRFIDHLAADLVASAAGRQVNLFDDELAHRAEHSIEFQVLFLQHVLAGKRKFSIVPVLAGSLHDFLTDGAAPVDAPEGRAFCAAVRAAAAGHRGKVCYISGADLAHIGPRFGDDKLLDQRRLAAQSADDHQLLELACRGDGAAFFRHVARQDDCNRICGLAPTFTMLEVLGSARGELLSYGQAVEPDQTACVSFAAAAFYR